MDLLKELGITREELIERAIGKILDLPAGYEQTGEEEYVEVTIHKEIRKAVDGKILSIVEGSKQVIQKTIDEAIKANVEAVFLKPFIRADRWGDPQGKETTIKDLIADEATAYWTKSVDENGNEGNSYGTKMTRAEFYAKKYMKEFYTKTLSEYAENMAKEARAKVPATFAEEVAKSFAKYFR